MSSLFIIGNGFDIAHGIPTKYRDFREFIIKLYPEARIYRDEVTLIEDMLDTAPEVFAAEILLSTMDRVAGEDWSNFEEALAYVNFDHKFPLPNHKENETEDEDNALMQNYLLYIAPLISGYISDSESWQKLFRLWIKEVQSNIEKDVFVGKESLKVLFSEPNTFFLTFNYTKTLQHLYGVNKVIHIHNRSGQTLIFGHGQDKATYRNTKEAFAICSCFLDDMLRSLKKDTASPFRKYNRFFKNLDSNVDKIYSYGFSYGKVDGIYIKEIIKRISPNATWYFTSFEATDKEALRIKKIKLRKYGFKGSFGVYEG